MADAAGGGLASGIPARTRRLVEDRDRGCAYPGCTATRFVEIHHITHWEDGGGTDYDNLVSLCPHHHTGHHQGAFTITPTPGDREGTCAGALPFTFHNSRCHPIQVHPPARPKVASVETGQPIAPARGASYRGPLGEHLDLGWVRFYPATERPHWLLPRLGNGPGRPPDHGADSAPDTG